MSAGSENREQLKTRWAVKHGKPRIRNLLGQADVEVEPQRSGDFVLEELPEAAVSGSIRRSNSPS